MFGRQMPFILGAYHSSSWFPAPAKFVYLLVLLYKLPSSKKTKSPREWLGNTMFLFDHLATLTRTDNRSPPHLQNRLSLLLPRWKNFAQHDARCSANSPAVVRWKAWRMNGGWSKSPDGYGSIPISTIFSGMNIHLPAILGFTRYQGFDPSPDHPGIDFMKVNIIFVLWGTALPTCY